MVEILFDDITGDGSVEWIIVDWGISSNFSSFEIYWLNILSWQDGELVSPSPKTPLGYRIRGRACNDSVLRSALVNWEFEDLDEDGVYKKLFKIYH